ncbi:hypothetical protein [Allorhizocola rhizosphaerae]|uniref:hypothetical protein n=1 Tax=Allorhizocola rhizosphaerae TaxID=1872709 RepID=UPI001FE565DD|nr:hypothetical protein [Allorhizocola rhizosphaerae]
MSEPGAPNQATLFGASGLGAGSTRELLQEFVDRADTVELRTGMPYHQMKSTFADLDPQDPRLQSEFFSQAMSDRTVVSLLTQFGEPRTAGRRQLTFTAMGGAHHRVADPRARRLGRGVPRGQPSTPRNGQENL